MLLKICGNAKRHRTSSNSRRPMFVWRQRLSLIGPPEPLASALPPQEPPIGDTWPNGSRAGVSWLLKHPCPTRRPLHRLCPRQPLPPRPRPLRRSRRSQRPCPLPRPRPLRRLCPRQPLPPSPQPLPHSRRSQHPCPLPRPRSLYRFCPRQPLPPHPRRSQHPCPLPRLRPLRRLCPRPQLLPLLSPLQRLRPHPRRLRRSL